MRSTFLLLFTIWCVLATSLVAGFTYREYDFELHRTVLEQIDETDEDVERLHASSGSNLLEMLENDGRFSVFVKFVNEDDVLKDVLTNSSASLTVFAPVDMAFKHIKKTPPKEIVRKVVLYHLSPKALKYKQVKTQRLIDSSLQVEALNNAAQKIRVGGWFRTVYLNWARVVDPDLKASNGYAHAINRVLLPPPDIVTGTFLVPTFFSTFSSAIQKVAFASSLKDSKAVTVFLPTNTAWARLGFRRLAYLFSPCGEEILKKVLLYHVSPQLVYTTNITSKDNDDDENGSDDISNQDGWDKIKRFHTELDSLEGSKIYVDAMLFRKRFLRVRVNYRATVTFTDGISKNGVAHIIDNVLLPMNSGLPSEEELAAQENTGPEFSEFDANSFGIPERLKGLEDFADDSFFERGDVSTDDE